MQKYFYYNPVKGYDISCDKPKSLDIDSAIIMMVKTIGDEPESFFGVINLDDVTLQFYLEDSNDRIRMEIPVPEKEGSYAKYVDLNKAVETVRQLKCNFCLNDFPDLKFEKW